ncbi:pseudouridine synthase [Sphingomonas sp. CFBP 13720]|uniref:pseudouridine synthase n=1 Tax=Sphingomonas sp. CFBP 13720 TaxID=2775302 RepID=UPI003138E166
MASRRDIERMIAAGRIAIDGTVVETPATVLTSLKGVTVDGGPVAAPEPTRLFRFHKPAGTLTAERDMSGRPTIYDRLPAGLPRLIPVGRLDLNTEGLLLMTTDGELKRRLELPATGVERTYRARAYGEVSQQQLEDLMLGIEVDGVRYGPINANLERRTGTNTWIEMTLTEGKNREVRRVLEHLGLKVSRLIRVRYGPFLLDDLPEAEVDEIRQHELVAFRKTLANKPTSKPIPEGADPAALKAWKRNAPLPRPEPVEPAPRARFGDDRRPRVERDGQRSGFAGRRPDRDEGERSGFAPRPRTDEPRTGFGNRPRPDGDRPGFAPRPRADEPRAGFGSRPQRDGDRPGFTPRPRTDEPRAGFGNRPQRDGDRPGFGQRASQPARPTGFRSHATERPVDRRDGFDPLAQAGQTPAERKQPGLGDRRAYGNGPRDTGNARTRRAAAYAERPGYDEATPRGQRPVRTAVAEPVRPARGGRPTQAEPVKPVRNGPVDRRMTQAEASEADRASFADKPGKRIGWAKAAAPTRPRRPGKPKGSGPKRPGPAGKR